MGEKMLNYAVFNATSIMEMTTLSKTLADRGILHYVRTKKGETLTYQVVTCVSISEKARDEIKAVIYNK